MYIQLCKIDDCHGNDYDAFGKRRDRHRELLRPLRAAMGRASRDAHRTVSMSLPDGVDVSVGRCRCRYRTVCMGNGGLRLGNGGLRDGGGLMRAAARTRAAARGKKRQSHGPSRTRRVLLGPWLCHEGAGIRTFARRARCSLPDGLSLHRCCRGRRRRGRCRGCPGGR